MPAAFRIGLLGLGHVGGALADRLTRDSERIAQAAGRPVTLTAIGVRNRTGRTAPAALTSVEELLARTDLDAIVELIGGLEPARTYIERALDSGRQVITANKQVIAAHGPALARLGALRFEASVASAIPVVEMLAETLAADQIDSVTGILNGTTNAMLHAMSRGTSYGDALARAQREGLAEADPSADVDGHDPAAKLAILIMLAFRRRIDPASITRKGIRDLNPDRLHSARQGGQVVKLVAAAVDQDYRIAADVRPRLVPAGDPLGQVDGPDNGILIDASYAGQLFLKGAGAGPEAAASAVVADLIRGARDQPASAGALLGSLTGIAPALVVPLGPGEPYPAANGSG
ncbi:MAG: homoserine dehydrogenase [Candidatus Dormibacteraeota bacterium]|nr:homoserine dehydrogenase [Candidatus Dormibacteraeota bacterium]